VTENRDGAAALNHDLSTVTVDATCAKDGSVTTTCSRCDIEETTTIQKLDHDFTELVDHKEPTCKDGYDLYKCSHCEETKEVTLVAIDEHAWEPGATVAPTCTEKGYTPYACTGCDATDRDEVDALEHDWVVKEVVKPTTDSQGYTVYECSACGETKKDDYVEVIKLYEVKVEGSHSLTSGAGSYAPGVTVTIDAGTYSGFNFAGWTVKEGVITLVSSSSTKTEFTMPSSNVTVSASWSVISGGSVPTGGGGPPIVTIPVVPTPLTALPPIENPFEDVSVDHWFFDSVMNVYQRGLMLGTSTKPMMFSPNMSLNRAMIVAILYRMEGSPSTAGLTNPFDDVAEKAWYTETIKWGAANDIVFGYGNGKFGPEDPVTKEQLAAILYRWQHREKRVLPDTGNGIQYSDIGDVSKWAAEVVKMVNNQGIFIGIPGLAFNPQKPATRAEAASMLYRYYLGVEAMPTTEAKSIGK
jgi:hypothetical protein